MAFFDALVVETHEVDTKKGGTKVQKIRRKYLVEDQVIEAVPVKIAKEYKDTTIDYRLVDVKESKVFQFLK